MRYRIKPFHIFLFLLFLFSLVYIQGIASVPFHPDESTNLYLSSDLGRVFKNPASMFWHVGSDDELHLLNPPLLQYTVEIGRRLGGFPPLPVNWGWRKTWEENEQRGALPSPQLLFMARLAVASLFPFSLLFLYLAARMLANEFTAWIAVIFMATNSLILLHTRRAMAEGILIFTLTLTLWVLLKADKRPWLAAIPIGLAFWAKLSLATLAFVGLFAVLWQPGSKIQAARRVRQILVFGLLLLGTVYLLMPIAWRHPIQTAQAVFHARQNMMSYVVNEYPGQAIGTPGQKAASLVNQLYFAPLMFYEDPSFKKDTQAAQTAYLANPLNTLSSSPQAGGIFLALSLFGLVTASFQVGSRDLVKKRRFTLVLMATLLQIVALLVTVPVSWQRYYLPLVPFVCIWTAYGVNQIKEFVRRPWLRRVIPAQ